MTFKAAITFVPKDDRKDKNNKHVLDKLNKHKITNVTDVVVGRYISVKIDANSKNAASALIDELSDILVNEELEKASFVIEEI